MLCPSASALAHPGSSDSSPAGASAPSAGPGALSQSRPGTPPARPTIRAAREAAWPCSPAPAPCLHSTAWGQQTESDSARPPPFLASFPMKTCGVTRARNRALPGRGVCQGLSETPSGLKFRSPSRCPQLHAEQDRRIPPAQSLALSLKREGPSHHCPPCTGPGQAVQKGLGILCGGVRGGLLDWEPWWSRLLLPLKLEPEGRTIPNSATIPLPRPAPQCPPRGHPHHGLRGLPPSHSWPQQERNPPRGLRLTQPCLLGSSQHQSPTGS